MKVLIYDLETSPNIGYFWKMWKENIGWNQVIEVGTVITWSAKWLDSDEVFSMSEFFDGTVPMLQGLHDLMEEADVIVAYNGNRFDRPVMNTAFVLNGFPPPAPAKQVDMYVVAKRQFRLLSNRMDAVAEMLGLEQKTDTGGFSLWSRCMDGEEEAWAEMLTYNEQDVIVLEQIYKELLAWIPNHPNAALYTEPQPDQRVCPTCGSTHVQSRGTSKTSTMVYRRFQCMDCKSWSRQRLSDKALQPKPQLVRDNTK